MKKTILIVEDETELALTIQEYLQTDEHYATFAAADVSQALRYLNDPKNKVDLILSDIRLPGDSGLDLFAHYKKEIDIENLVPFVLMTGHADIISVQNAFKVGVDELIAKPFDLEAVKLVIDYLLENDKNHGTEKEQYFCVPIDDFILSKKSDYTVYLKVANKYARVTKSGQDFTPQRLENFAKKGVTHIYLNSSDFAKYTDMQFVIAKAVATRPMDIVKKAKVMNHLMSSISQNSIVNKIDRQFVDKSLNAFESYTQAAMNNAQVLNIMSFLTQAEHDLSQVCTLRSVLASTVLSAWKWNSPKIQSRMILASLLCDVGLKDHPELLKKKRFEYSPEEVKLYEQHPFNSYQILSQIDGVPEEVLFVALQHHENAAGFGFPQKLPRSKTHAFSKVVHGVGEFVETLLQQDDPSQVQQALEHMFSIQNKIVSEQVLKTLYMIFNVKVPRQIEGLLLPTETTRIA